MSGKAVGVIEGESECLLWGMSNVERLRRSLRRAGVDRAIAASREPEGVKGAGPAVILRADWVFDDALVRDLVRQPGVALCAEPGGAIVAAHGELASAYRALAHPESPDHGLCIMTPAELTSSYNNALRKRELPYLLRLEAPEVPAIERRMFAGSYKGVTDFVTKYLWPEPARHVTKWCAVRGITPNQVTWVSLALVLAAFALFWNGFFGWGLAAAWLMTFLDTVDGKLARVTLTSTKVGNAFDHGIDLVHPPFWWWAWIVGLPGAGHDLPNAGLITAVVVIGYVAQRIQEGVFIAWFKIDIHTWRKFDSWFRLITARRNPNLVILTVATLFGRPDLGMIAVAIWTALCLLVHMTQIVQAALARRQGPIDSWLAT